MTRRDDQGRTGLEPLTIGVALGGAAVAWLVIDLLRRLL
jgi:hypothetical protein